MAKIQFTHAMHDDYDFGETIDNILTEAEIPTEQCDELYEKMVTKGNPFYEVIFKCELDTETGEITVLSTELRN